MLAHYRKYEVTLMTCLLYDPFLKVLLFQSNINFILYYFWSIGALRAIYRILFLNVFKPVCQLMPHIAYWNLILFPLYIELWFSCVSQVRLASAATIAAMLEEPASIALQVAEYRESTKCGSFTALSSSLGQILMQLHAGMSEMFLVCYSALVC